MNKKELLNTLIQYKDIKLEISKLEKRIDRVKKLSYMVSDVVQNGYKRHTVIYGVDLKRTNKIEELEFILQQRYDQLLEKQILIEDYLNTLQENDIRQILEHRYIDGMNWIQIQGAMRYSSESTARMKHDRFFKKIL